MDEDKCKALKADLVAQPEAEFVPIDRYFDGNDDLASIGCNLSRHPGIDAFRQILTGLLQRRDVQGVYARIFELDPGDSSWPFTDTIFVFGTISPVTLREILRPLEPDEVDYAESIVIPLTIKQQYEKPVLYAWWD